MLHVLSTPPFPTPRLQADVVEVSTTVRVVDQAPRSGGGPEVLGVFADTFTVQLLAAESPLPGVGYTFTAHTLKWTQPISGRRASAHQKCRVQ